ncbi:MAG: hypothetical protein A2042_05885 [Candidatus Schekmanbacteria bacterium GWA2_38_11]|uniref:Class II aldolase/adducin N-terminal domain-containing protein n=1 Tax=Candidatus Schekmanbacteria bacterium GWA2_38_11 TaxID=1817876 RepID=A0A1F7RN76_9BACT|nr:MAG: hypothetical protein A2042_05885 [Candidatus Schekmanbacteria bacterium GWA2_38_11]
MEDISNLKNELINVSKRCFCRGLTSGSGGNISVRIHGEDKVLVTGTGVSFIDTSLENIITVDLEANVIEGNLKPSKEIKWHCGIYKLRSDVGAIVHSHSPACMAFTVANKLIPLLTTPIAKTLGNQKIIPSADPGSEELAKYVLGTFAEKENQGLKVLLMQNHGAIATGKNLTEAFNIADVLEDAAKIAIYRKFL